MTPQKITPFLWFPGNAEEAMNLYISIFPDSRVLQVKRHGADAGEDAGKVLYMRFQLAGQTFYALNGEDEFPFTEAISFFVTCEDQAEVDELWSKLTAHGGSEVQCGWCKDKFGVRWQIIPRALMDGMEDPDPAAANRVFEAMLQMKKIDVAKIEAARQGTPL
jgi:predicted 3-demethylubiquinone-9 3-methyltransferase (glyoxalase superfamily)